MSNGITLAYDTNSISSISSQKVMVAVPLLYIFLVKKYLCRLIMHFSYCDLSKEIVKLLKGLMILVNVLLCMGLQAYLASISCRAR